MTRHFMRSAAAAAILVLAASAAAIAANSSTIHGVIALPDGTVAPHVRVNVNGPEFATDTVSDANGRYVIYGVPPGRYAITVSKPGKVDALQWSILAEIHVDRLYTCDFAVQPATPLDVAPPTPTTVVQCPFIYN